MTTAVQHRRGTTAEHAAFTGLEGELTIDTTKDTAVIHDGTLAGGYPLAKENLANVNTSGLSSIDGASTASDDKFFIYDQSATALKTITRAELNNAIEQDALANVAITGGTINGTTIGGTTAAAVSATTLTTSSTVTLNGGTANGVAYLNGSKVLTTGSALTFDGSSFVTTSASTAYAKVRSSGSGTVAASLYQNADTGTTNSDGFYVGISGTTPYIYNYENSPIVFATNNSEQMRLTSTGLGIGTSSPGAKLDVVGSAQIGASTAKTKFYSDSTYNGIFNGASLGSNESIYMGGGMQFFYASGAERMRLDSSGNLGIGTSSPAYKLTINDAAGDYYPLALTSGAIGTPTNYVGMRFGYSGNTYQKAAVIFQSADASGRGTLHFCLEANANSNNADLGDSKLQLDYSGNLGLGVTPSAWYSGAKAFQFGGTGAIFNNGTNVSYYVHNAYYDTSWKYIGSGYANYFAMDTGAYKWFTAPSGTAGNAISFSQSMTLDASGNLGIGTTGPSAKVHIAGSSATDFKALTLRNGDGTTGSAAVLGFEASTGTLGDDAALAAQIKGIRTGSGTSGALAFWTNNAGTPTERARITSGGEFLVGDTTTSATSGSGFKVTTPVSGHWDPAVVTSGNNASYSCWDIYSTGAGAYRFYVTTTGVINATNTTISAISDIRFKENVRDLDVGLDAVMALKPRLYDWKEGKGANIKNARGFIAQEFEQVFPDLIDEWKDPAPEGEEPYKSVRQDLIPVLVKAIQEQQAIITAQAAALESLTARVAALESI